MVNMKDKVSIVVPVYNVEKYIKKCLDSLVKQDYDNYDVLVINDGSPYNEQLIIDEYVKKYPNIIKSIVKENGGYGSALELAFKTSDADYVLVCDPDDYLAKDALSTLIEYKNETNADLVVGAKYHVYEDSKEEDYDASYNSEFGKLIDKKIYKKDTSEYEMLYFLEPSPHAKLYRRDIVSKIRFPHKVSYTDNLLYFYTLNNVDTVTYCEKALSYYLINRSGNTHTDVKASTIDNRVMVFNSLLEQVKNGSPIFYYRMFESFYFVYYKVDEIKGNEEIKLKEYDVLYSFLEKLIPYSKQILEVNKRYKNDSATVLKQKKDLLDKDKSRKAYDSLVNKRLSGSFKTRLKQKLSKLRNI